MSKPFVVLFLLIIARCLCVPIANAQQLGATVLVSDPRGSGQPDATSPCIHVLPDGQIYATWFSGTVSIHFSRSLDGGRSFLPSVIASQAITSNSFDAMFQRSPSFAVDRNGVIHLVWTEDRVNAQNDVWYVRSSDSGKTWTQPVSIMDADDSTKYSQDFASIAIDSSNRIYVSFLDNRELLRKTSTNYQLYLLKSTNGGQTWSKAIRMSRMPNGLGGTCECCKQELVASPEGHLYAAFRSNINNVRDIYIARSMDQGDSWDTAIKAQSGTWTISACPTTGPNIVLDRAENLHIVWKDSRDAVKRSIAYYTLLPKNANRVLPNIAISRKVNQSANWPSVSLGSDGILVAAFQVTSNAGSELRYTVSSDGGSTWSVDTTINSSGDDEQLADLDRMTDGKYMLAWMNSPASGGSDIEMAPFTTMPSPVAPRPVIVVGPKDSSLRPMTVGSLVWQRPIASMVWFDATLSGGTINDSAQGLIDTTWSLPALPAGTYRYSVTTHSSTGEAVTNGSFTTATASVSMRGSEASVGLFPNPVPSGERLIVIDPGSMAITTITLTDMLGRIQLQQAVTNVSARIELSIPHLPAGTYTLSLGGKSEEIHRRFVVE